MIKEPREISDKKRSMPMGQSEYVCAKLSFVKHSLSDYADAIRTESNNLPVGNGSLKNILLIGDESQFLDQIIKNVGTLDKREITQVLVKDFELGQGTHYDVIAIVEPKGEALSELLLKFVDYPTVVIAAITGQHMTQRGIYIVTIPKSGSHLLYDLMSDMGFSHDQDGYNNDDDLPQPATWKTLLNPHSHVRATDFFDYLSLLPFGGSHHPFFMAPGLFMYRNPCDIVISEMDYYINPLKSSLAFYFGKLSEEERLCALIGKEPLIGDLDDRIKGFLPWLHLSNVIPVSYEELVGESGGGCQEEQLRTLWSLQLKLHASGSPLFYAESIAARRGKNATFNKGLIGRHKQFFKDIHWKLMLKDADNYMPRLGYEADHRDNDYLPAHRSIFRHRPVIVDRTKITKKAADKPADSECKPALMLLENFCGFNILSCAGKVFALDMSVGEVDFADAERLKDLTARGHLLVTDTFNSTKMAVLSYGLNQIRKEVGGLTTQIVPQPTKKREEPQLLEEGYFGYNLVAYSHKVWAVEMAVGPVDFTNAVKLKELQEKGHLLSATNMEGIRTEVQRLIDKNGLDNISDLKSAIAKLNMRLDDTDGIIGRVKNELFEKANNLNASMNILKQDLEEKHKTIILLNGQVDETTKSLESVTALSKDVTRLNLESNHIKSKWWYRLLCAKR